VGEGLEMGMGGNLELPFSPENRERIAKKLNELELTPQNKILKEAVLECLNNHLYDLKNLKDKHKDRYILNFYC